MTWKYIHLNLARCQTGTQNTYISLEKKKKGVYIELVEELTAGQRSSLKITSFHPHVNEYVLS